MATFIVTTLDNEFRNGGTLEQETADGNGLSVREAFSFASFGTHTITFAPIPSVSVKTAISVKIGCFRSERIA